MRWIFQGADWIISVSCPILACGHRITQPDNNAIVHDNIAIKSHVTQQVHGVYGQRDSLYNVSVHKNDERGDLVLTQRHYSYVTMSTMASQITGVLIVYSTVCSRADEWKHQSSASLAFVRGIHRWPVNFPHKGPVTWKIVPFDDVIMYKMFSMVCALLCFVVEGIDTEFEVMAVTPQTPKCHHNRDAAEVVVTFGSLWCHSHDRKQGINFCSIMVPQN